MKIIFMGTPDFSVNVLKELINNYKVDLVITQPDKKVGRKAILRETPVKICAKENNIKVISPSKIKEEIETIKNIEPDLIITCAYGQILPKEILDIPVLGCINVHASLLPKLRGGAPIHKAIIEGYEKTGISIMYMDEKMDSGDIIKQKELIIENDDTAETLHDKLSLLGAKLLIDTLPSIINKTNKRLKQNELEVTYAYNVSREDEKINFNKTSKEIFNQIRGLNSWPGAYTTLDNKIIKVWESKIIENNENIKPGTITNIYKEGFGVKTKDGELILLKISPEGKKKMNAKDFANGHNIINKIME